MAKWQSQSRTGNGILMESNNKDSVTFYDGDNLSILPIGKAGIGICERCGKIDLKRKLFGHRKTSCGNRGCIRHVNISNAYNFPDDYKLKRNLAQLARLKNISTHKFVLMENEERMEGMIPMESLPQLDNKSWLIEFDSFSQPIPSKQTHAATDTYEWSNELFGCDFLAAPVKLFRHAPLNDVLDETFEGMKVEVRNEDRGAWNKNISDFFWVASIIKIKGYMGLLRYEGYGSDDSKDFWVNLCSSEIHPVGWCAARGKPIVEPKSIGHKYADWKKFLVKQLSGARRFPVNFYTKFCESLKSRFEPNMAMEVVDKNCISQVKLATVVEIVGKRLRIRYFDSPQDDPGFWCHEDSPLIHPVGWAFQIGHRLNSPIEYAHRVKMGIIDRKDALPYHFPHCADFDDFQPLFEEGMKLEAIDPLNLSSVCAATVMQVLRGGYMMARVDCYPAATDGSDWFCYHQHSPCVFPVGFCAANNIPLKPPTGYNTESFQWEHYLEESGAVAAPPELFKSTQFRLNHGFVAGMKLECADLMDPRLVCVATVARVVGNLLKVHFDGWGDEYDQWLGVGSTDIYPVGWCKAVGHKLEGPNEPKAVSPPKPKLKRGPKKRKINQSPIKVVKNASNEAIEPDVVDEATTDSKIPSEDTSQSSNTDSKTVNSPLVDSADSVLEGAQEEESVSADTEECSKIDEIGQESSQDKESNPLSPFEEESMPMPSSFKADGVETLPIVNEEDPIAVVFKEEKRAPPDDDVDLGNVPDVMDEDSNDEVEKIIPRLVGTPSVSPDLMTSVKPESWTVADVSKFLTVNDCSPYCINFNQIDGKMLLELTKDKIIELLEMKVGPSLKIFDLINQLKYKLKPLQSRIKSNFK